MSNVPHAPTGDRARGALRSKTGGLTKVGDSEVETKTGRDMFEVQQVWMAKICKKCKINFMHTSDKGDRARPDVCTLAKPDTRRRCERVRRTEETRPWNKVETTRTVVSTVLELARVLDDPQRERARLLRLPPPSLSSRSPPTTLDAVLKLLPT
ncbi:hypothetical protein C8T65DRAFT_751119 [Cerioporus squamosus]|nr:hypothetical protein C8T65DRAFT_751119 [Cerioporus squamosus]